MLTRKDVRIDKLMKQLRHIALCMRININRYYILLAMVLLGVTVAHSQERRFTDIYIEFPVNKSELDPNFRDNKAHLDEIISFIEKINRDTTLSVVKLSFCGSASPEGSSELNRKLSLNRLKALEEYVRSRVEIPDSVIRYDDSYIPWRRLRDFVIDSDIDRKQEVLDILNMKRTYVSYYGDERIDKRVVELSKLDGGAVWRQLGEMFPQMRSAHAVFITKRKLPGFSSQEGVHLGMDLQIDTIHPHLLPLVDNHLDEYRHLHVATNLPAWGLLLSNATVEIDLSRHWSLALPVYYSALNYFADDVKFRTLTLQPELRYWFRGCESSWYAGAHAGISYFNVAWGELFRYQDHQMNTPALGGGLSVGYRKPLGSSKHWCLDLSVGAGIYAIHYDRFINVENGFLVDSHETTYTGIDQASISLSYMFNLAKLKRR